MAQGRNPRSAENILMEVFFRSFGGLWLWRKDVSCSKSLNFETWCLLHSYNEKNGINIAAQPPGSKQTLKLYENSSNSFLMRSFIALVFERWHRKKLLLENVGGQQKIISVNLASHFLSVVFNTFQHRLLKWKFFCQGFYKVISNG